MIWFFAVLTVLLMGGIAAVAAGKGRSLAPEYDDRPESVVPGDRQLLGQDLRTIRFPLAFRGYRMAEVDALLDRVARQLDDSGAEPRPGWAPSPRLEEISSQTSLPTFSEQTLTNARIEVTVEELDD
jgi:DivIVA domain-containing protein